MPVHITIDNVVKAARERLPEIQACQPEIKSTHCIYAAPCLIGTAVQIDKARELDAQGDADSAGIGDLIDYGDITTIDEAEADLLGEAQTCHDAIIVNEHARTLPVETRIFWMRQIIDLLEARDLDGLQRLYKTITDVPS